MATKTEVTVEEKLRALYDLQLIDSRIDEIRSVRGELPLEVEDLEDEVAGMNTRLEKLKSGLEVIEDQIKEKKNNIEESKALIKKYSSQQDNVRNNREYNSLSKEVEFQELEIQLSEKNIKEYRAQIGHRKQGVQEMKARFNGSYAHSKEKQHEHDHIQEQSENEEQPLVKGTQDSATPIDDRLTNAYA